MIFKPSIGNGLFHGQNRIGSPFAHKAKLFAINMIGNIKLDGAMHLTAESKLGIFRCGNNARGSVTQRIGDFADIISNRGNDSDSGNGNTAHDL
jgi:hypothetical protein